MGTNKPMRGLLSYFYYSYSENIAIVMLLSLVLGVATVITGHTLVNNVFAMVGVAGIPYIIMMGMGGKSYPNWERFQLTMPVRRSHLIGSQYLCILLASLVGLPLVVLVKVITFALHEIDYSLTTALLNTFALFGTPLMMAGILFPLANTKFGENKGELFFSIGIFAAIGNFLLIHMVGNIYEWADGIASAVAFAVAVVMFVMSYLITNRIYAKLDF